MRIVVAEQKYDEKLGTPEVQFPAFAIVLRMRNPEKFRPVAEEAWQKAIGLVNFTRGQQALPGLIIDRPTHEGERYTVAGFGPPTGADKSAVDVRFNFQPALAMPGPYLIISSTAGLAKDLIAAVKQEEAGRCEAAAANPHLDRTPGQTTRLDPPRESGEDGRPEHGRERQHA